MHVYRKLSVICSCSFTVSKNITNFSIYLMGFSKLWLLQSSTKTLLKISFSFYLTFILYSPIKWGKTIRKNAVYETTIEMPKTMQNNHFRLFFSSAGYIYSLLIFKLYISNFIFNIYIWLDDFFSFTKSILILKSWIDMHGKSRKFVSVVVRHVSYEIL